jgi:hypothetical protein
MRSPPVSLRRTNGAGGKFARKKNDLGAKHDAVNATVGGPVGRHEKRRMTRRRSASIRRAVNARKHTLS